MQPRDESAADPGKLALDKISASDVQAAQDAPDPKTKKETTELKHRLQSEKIRSLSQDIDERKKYAHRIFCLICGWLGATFLVLVADGIAQSKWFYLPEGVLLALIGGTSADVLGIFYIVTHYLFPQNPPPADSDEEDGDEESDPSESLDSN
ncbi:MAG TPA: hypothetical protein VHX60_17930 [Acidobacteriaceae bacterium]|jgi:hypothetical protein|nr:hypothetical protein [Acidobacteriaceae bacterium]